MVSDLSTQSTSRSHYIPYLVSWILNWTCIPLYFLKTLSSFLMVYKWTEVDVLIIDSIGFTTIIVSLLTKPKGRYLNQTKTVV